MVISDSYELLAATNNNRNKDSIAI